jgi:hypothetical protein
MSDRGASNPLSKSKAAPLTPAQEQANQIAQLQNQRSQQFWLPIQQYFSNRLDAEQPAEKEQDRGTGAQTAVAQAGAMASKDLSKDMQTGASIGSGKYVLNAGAGGNNVAQAATSGATAGGAMADRAYAQGLQKVIAGGQAMQRSAQQGLNTAAAQEGQEAGIETQGANQQNAGSLQAIGTTIAAMA